MNISNIIVHVPRKHKIEFLWRGKRLHLKIFRCVSIYKSNSTRHHKWKLFIEMTKETEYFICTTESDSFHLILTLLAFIAHSKRAKKKSQTCARKILKKNLSLIVFSLFCHSSLHQTFKQRCKFKNQWKKNFPWCHRQTPKPVSLLDLFCVSWACKTLREFIVPDLNLFRR